MKVCGKPETVDPFHRILEKQLNSIGWAMERIKLAKVEEKCPACNGTGFPAVKQPAPGRRIFPPPCEKCQGSGRIKKAAN